jgi:simple sugar transport system permease protein
MTEFLASLLTISFAATVVRIAIPYVLAALGGALSERAGVIDLALEAKLLVGAFAAAVVTHESGSIGLGLVAAAAAAAAVAAVQVTWAVHFGADQVVTGIACNLAAFGLTRYLLGAWYGQTANSPPIHGLDTGLAASPITWLALAIVVIVVLGLGHTRLGLRIRAVGERPDAVAAAGVSVARVRWLAVVTGGAIAGLGGAQLSLTVDGFVADASGGRGYVALAAVILAGWRPGRAAMVCLAFGLTEAIEHRLQTVGTGVPAELVNVLPFALTLALLAMWPRRIHAPSALGRTEVRHGGGGAHDA